MGILTFETPSQRCCVLIGEIETLNTRYDLGSGFDFGGTTHDAAPFHPRRDFRLQRHGLQQLESTEPSVWKEIHCSQLYSMSWLGCVPCAIWGNGGCALDVPERNYYSEHRHRRPRGPPLDTSPQNPQIETEAPLACGNQATNARRRGHHRHCVVREGYRSSTAD